MSSVISVIQNLRIFASSCEVCFRKWLYNIAKGIHFEPVTTRLISKSIGCCKNFPGRTALTTPENIEHWVNELISEILERLERDIRENNRRAKQITLHFTQALNGKETTNSRTLPLSCYDQAKMSQICLDAIKKYCVKPDGTYDIRYLGFSVGNFEINNKNGKISQFFENMRNSKLQKNELVQNIDSAENAAASKQNTLENTKLLPNIITESVDVIPEQELFVEEKLSNENSTSEELVNCLDEDEINNQTYQDNASVYSAETDDLNEDAKSFIFYEDIFPEKVSTEPIFSKSINACNYLENEFVTNEVSLKNSIDNDLFIVQEPSSSSFFSKYFQNNNFDLSPVERNFDTSKILMPNYSDEINSDDSTEIIQNNVEESIDSQIVNEGQNQMELNSETCPECNRTILKSELVSHMDYHYALNIVKNEAYLYKPMQSNMAKESHQSSNNQPKPDIKKKIVDVNSIHSYLQKGELNEENSELCSECNKRIKLEDVINHMDYHTAKKLHLEINAKSFISKRNSVEEISVKKMKKNVKKSIGSISSFFNRTGT